MLGIKNKAERFGTKIKNQSSFGKKGELGRKIHNTINDVDNVIQNFRPLERIPVIGAGVGIMTGLSGAMHNLNDAVYNKSKRQDNDNGNSLERNTVIKNDDSIRRKFV